MKRNYECFELKDFLVDDFFLRWNFFPSEEVNDFWSKYIEDHPEQQDVIYNAQRVLDNIGFNESDITEEEIDNLYNNILLSYDKQNGKKTKRINLYKFIGYAASVAILGLALYNIFPIKRGSGAMNPALSSLSITSDTTSIKLYVDNKEFSYNGDVDIEFNQKSNSIQIINKGEVQNEIDIESKTIENKIVVPNGKRSTLLLSDGTMVYLNSGTTMLFPSQFSETRLVKVEGEIYISVQKDENRPFIVQTKEFDIKVLGTSFNVSAYSSDSENSVVLEEGSIEIDSKRKNQSLKLTPGEMFFTNGDRSHVSEVDTYKYSSWKDGVLYFTEEPLKNVTTKLARYYGVNIYYDPTLAGEGCTGKLVLFDDLKEVMNTLADILPIKYNIENNRVNIEHK